MEAGRIWRKGRSRERPIEILTPSAWRGQVGCAVGPFASHQLADRYRRARVERGRLPLRAAPQGNVFAHQDSWYIEVFARR